jgi:F0F1-type ATP synthase epsilon subunit
MNESGVPNVKKLDGRTTDESGRPVTHVKVHSPYRTYFDGEAYSISAENITGPFDILPHHHNFMTLLTPSIVTVRPAHGTDQSIRISGGLMHVKADRVTIFLDV